MEESITEDMPDIIIPPVEVNMVVDDTPIIVNNDTINSVFSNYKKGMLQSGLDTSDLDYLEFAFKTLEDVKYIKIHCTSCDKHIGSAPNDLQNRYEHPLLKVLLCGDCFQFYSSGDFEKDEDGSELYCRWCGEGGQVFCCTKCPFVFCKRCIRLNLGKGTAKIILNCDNWMCFSCDSSQICRLRATYWAVQKYSEEMINNAKLTGDVSVLSVDANTCCSAIRRRPDNKIMQPPRKKQKVSDVKSSTSKSNKGKQEKNPKWKPFCIAEQPEDEVICTPDILPLDESPPHSPEERAMSPPALTPFVPRNASTSTPIASQVPPLVMRPTVPNMSIQDLQNHLQKKYNQIILTPRPRMKPPMVQNHQALLIRKPAPILPKFSAYNNGNLRLLLNSKPPVMNSNYTNRPVNPLANTPVSVAPVATTSKLPEKDNSNNDWFDQAVKDCSEVTEYISTKISSLSGVHTRAYKSEKLMEELYNTFQTYMHVANEKINKVRRIMQVNFEKDIEKHFKKQKMVNPFAIKTAMRQSNCEELSTSEDSNSSGSVKSKTKFVLTKNIRPEEVMFDMDVTNASDEETPPVTNSQRATPLIREEKNNVESDSDDDVQEIICKKSQEVIHIIDSDDETKEENSEIYNVPSNLIDKIKDKFNIKNISSAELITYLSPIIVLTNEINREMQELSDSKDLLKSDEIRQNVENKLITSIQKLLEDQNIEDKNNEETAKSSDDMETERSKIYDNLVVEKEKEESNKIEESYKVKKANQIQEAVKMEESDNIETNITSQEENDNKEEDEDDEATSETSLPNGENECSDDQNKNLCDIEEILDSNVVLRPNKNAVSFGDEFSKFVCEKADVSPSYDESDDMSDSLKDSLSIARELDIIPEYVNDICNNRDNGSLSLPPDSITEITASEVEMLMKQKIGDEKDESDLDFNSDLLALKQITENISENSVTKVDVHKTSTECKG